MDINRTLLICLIVSLGTVSGSAEANWRKRVVDFLVGIGSALAAEEILAQDKTEQFYYVSCITNDTNTNIKYQFRWDSETEWTDLELKPNWHDWRGHINDQKLHIKFDYSFADGYQYKSYYLLRQYTEKGCAGGKRYSFYITANNEIDMRERNWQ